MLRAEGLYASGLLAAAATHFERVLADEPQNADTIQRLIEIRVRQKRPDQVVTLAERLARVPGREVPAYSLLAALHQEAGRIEQAMACYLEIVERDPQLRVVPADAVQLLRDLSQGLLRLGRAAEAERYLGELVRRLGSAEFEPQWWLSRALLQQGKAAEAEELLNRLEANHPDWVDERRRQPELAPAVGARACGECHAQNFEKHSRTAHARTFLPVDFGRWREKIEQWISDPGNASIRHRYEIEGDQLRLAITDGSNTLRARVEFEVGSGKRGVTLIGHNGAGKAVEFRLSYYPDEVGWDLTPGQRAEQPVHFAEYLGRSFDEKGRGSCVLCHQTDLTAMHESPDDSMRWGVQCKSCHGPGGNHVPAVSGKTRQLAIVHPGKLPADELVNLCGRCHGLGLSVPPGVNAVRLQAPGLLASRCDTASNGKLTCLTCHEPHQDARTDACYYELKCLSCHEPTGGTTCPTNSTSGCLSCHMARETGMPHTQFTDHHIRKPMARSAASIGRAEPVSVHFSEGRD